MTIRHAVAPGHDGPTFAPARWDRCKLKYVASIEGGCTPSKSNPDYWSGAIPWVSPKDMKVRVIRDSEDHVSEEALRDTSLRLIGSPVVLIVVRGMILAHTLPVAVTAAPVTINQDMKALRSRVGVSTEHLAYFLEGTATFVLSTMVEESAHGTKCLRADVWQDLSVLIPNLDEQRAIAAFLDRETARIDALIDKKRRQIELLHEKRAALISHAVTRGLDPNAPMKDSGIAWLGPIPAHWLIKRFRFDLTSMEQGWSPQCDNSLAEPHEWGVLKVGCVNGTRFDESEHKRLPDDLEPRTVYEIKPGDILMSRANTTELLGSAVLVRKVRPRLLLCDKLYRIRIDPRSLDPEFVVYAFGSHATRYQLERDATGASASMKNIGQDTIKGLLMPRAPVDEQRHIVRGLNALCERMYQVVAKVCASIDRLREYRTALISAAVTGQIDVRQEVA